jgi:3D (Asp-Asp-Asp) domain-containing protein
MSRKLLNVVVVLSLFVAISVVFCTPVQAYELVYDSDEFVPIRQLLAESEAPQPEQPAEPKQDGQEVQIASALPQTLTYQVNSGDTLYKISRDFGVSIQTLMSANDIEDPKFLRIGQQLKIPAEAVEVNLPGGSDKVVKRVLVSNLTAYTAGKESTGKTPSHPAYGITYSGSRAEEGRTIAVDPNVIPLGSVVFIDGIGIRKAEDTGSAIRGSRIDVFVDDVKEAVQFGVKKNVKVFVLSDGNV